MGEVTWHSLTEDGKVEIVDIKFGNKTYENVNVKHLKPIKMEAHGHPAADKDDEKKDENVKTEITINGKRYKAIR